MIVYNNVLFLQENEFLRNMSQTLQQWSKTAEQQGKQFFDSFNPNAKPQN